MNDDTPKPVLDPALEADLRLALGAPTARAHDPRTALIDRMDEALEPFPTGPRGGRLMAAARALFQPKRPGVLRLVLRAVGRRLEVLDVLGDQLEPVPARGHGEEGVLVRHRFGPHEVTTHVATAPRDRFVVTLDLWGDPAPPADVRVTLLRADRELASEVPRRGRVHFPPVPKGRYRVVVAGATGHVGELDLCFDDAAA